MEGSGGKRRYHHIQSQRCRAVPSFTHPLLRRVLQLSSSCPSALTDVTHISVGSAGEMFLGRACYWRIGGVDRDTGLVEGGYRALSVITADIPSSSLSACISGPACPAQVAYHWDCAARDTCVARLQIKTLGNPERRIPSAGFAFRAPYSLPLYFPHHRP